jgi:ketosteroid isomerase-like protein
MKSFKNLASLVVAVLLAQGAYAKDKSPKKESEALKTVQTMFGAFSKGDVEGMKKTVSQDTVWSYAGPKSVPYTGVYKGPDGVAQFVQNIGANVDIQDFQVREFITQGNTVVVLGSEKQKIKKNGEVLEQNWVQVYKVKKGLIISMDEYADTAHSSSLFSK